MSQPLRCTARTRLGNQRPPQSTSTRSPATKPVGAVLGRRTGRVVELAPRRAAVLFREAIAAANAPHSCRDGKAVAARPTDRADGNQVESRVDYPRLPPSRSNRALSSL